MEVIVKKNYEEMSKAAATLFAAEIMENPKTILGMATGSTPVGLYKELVKMYEAGDLDFSQVTTFNLDEYIGLAPEHDQSYHYFMHDHFFDHVNIDPSRINLPNGMEPDEKKEIDLTDSTIEANKRFFEKKEDVPRKAVSMGIGTIMRAKKIVLLVNGENKAEILKEVVNGPVTPKVPGSILQFHPHVTVICDEEAAKYL